MHARQYYTVVLFSAIWILKNFLKRLESQKEDLYSRLDKDWWNSWKPERLILSLSLGPPSSKCQSGLLNNLGRALWKLNNSLQHDEVSSQLGVPLVDSQLDSSIAWQFQQREGVLQPGEAGWRPGLLPESHRHQTGRSWNPVHDHPAVPAAESETMRPAQPRSEVSSFWSRKKSVCRSGPLRLIRNFLNKSFSWDSDLGSWLVGVFLI